MTRILLFILFNLPIIIFGQDSISLKSDSSSTKYQSFTTEQKTKKRDTFFLDLESGIDLDLPLKSSSNTKIVVLKEKSNTDYLLYIIPILTLLLGIGIKELLEKWSARKKIIKSGERWIAELRSLQAPLEQQIESLEKFQLENDTGEFEIPNLGLYSAVSGEVFKSLDKSELIKYIELKNKSLDFKKVVKISNRTNGYISILEHLFKTIDEKFDSYIAGMSKYTSEFTKNIQAFNLAFADYGVALELEKGSDAINDPRYKEIAALFNEFITPNLNDGKFNPYVLDERFFLPIISILSHYRLEPQTKPLIVVITACLNSIKGLRMEKEYITMNIKVLIILYQKQLDDLDEITAILEKH